MYSFHSSISELKNFVNTLNATTVHPCVQYDDKGLSFADIIETLGLEIEIPGIPLTTDTKLKSQEEEDSEKLRINDILNDILNDSNVDSPQENTCENTLKESQNNMQVVRRTETIETILSSQGSQSFEKNEIDGYSSSTDDGESEKVDVGYVSYASSSIEY